MTRYRSPRARRYLHAFVFWRDEGRCRYCGDALQRRLATVDHLIPRSRGGPDVAENLVIACYDCNQRKANALISEVGMVLRHVSDVRTMAAWRALGLRPCDMVQPITR